MWSYNRNIHKVLTFNLHFDQFWPCNQTFDDFFTLKLESYDLITEMFTNFYLVTEIRRFLHLKTGKLWSYNQNVDSDWPYSWNFDHFFTLALENCDLSTKMLTIFTKNWKLSPEKPKKSRFFLQILSLKTQMLTKIHLRQPGCTTRCW